MREDATLVSRFTMEVATAVATAALGATTMIGASEHSIGWGDAGPEPGYFPFWIGLIVVVASIGAMVQAFVRHRGTGEVFLTRVQGCRLAAFVIPVFLFVPIALFLGLYVTTAIYLLAKMTLQGRYSIRRALPIAVGAPVFLFIVFERWFQVPLLKGPLEAMLGFY